VTPGIAEDAQTVSGTGRAIGLLRVVCVCVCVCPGVTLELSERLLTDFTKTYQNCGALAKP